MRALDAVRAGLGGGLIEASAGTGKTFTITTLFLRLLLERELSVGQILVVTFTTAATAELRERIRSRLRHALATFDAPTDEVLTAILAARGEGRERARSQLQAALRDFDEAAIFTIHSLCQRILQNHAFESGVSFDAELVQSQDHLLREVVSDYWGEALYQASPTWVRHVVEQGVTADSLIELAKMGVADPEMPVLPGPVAIEELEALEAVIAAARENAAAIWKTEREPVLALLRTLNGTKYKGLPGWPPILDAVLAGTHAGGVTGFDRFFRFTSAGIADGLKKGQAMPAHPFFAACDGLHAAAQAGAGAVSDRLLAFRRDLVAYARREVPRRKEATRTLGFDDLLHRLDAALAGPGGSGLAATIRGLYKVALIDEFQDTDPVQYRIFRAVYGSEAAAGMFLIGDPKQAIYSFRGADVFAYLRAARDAQGHSFTLDTNYRSDPGLIRAVNAIFSRARAPFLLGDIRFSEAKPAPTAAARLHGGTLATAPFRLLFAKRDEPDGKPRTKGWADRHLPEAIAADVARLLQSGATIEGRAVSAGDIAVLVRANKQASAVQRALRELRVPSVLQGDASVLDAPEAIEVQRVLAAMADASGSGAVRLALSTSLFALDAHEIHALERDDAAWDRWVLRFQAWGKRWEEHGFIAAFRLLLDQQEAAPRLLRLVDGERRLTNLLHLAELLHVAASREHLGPAGLLRWLAAVRHDTEARERFGSEAAQVRLESDDHAVKLVTIHKSKGLQYPIVYCPYLWDGKLVRDDAKKALRFHDPANDHRTTLDLGSAAIKDHLKHAEREAAAENLRLLYVALTRAKHQVAVVWGSFNDAATSPLGYLLHQPAEVAGDLFEATSERLKKLDDGAMVRELFELSASAPGAIGIEELSFARGEVYTPPAGDAAELHGREVERTIERWWRTSSFTALVSGGGSEAAREAEGRDRDARAGMLRRDAAAALAATSGSEAPAAPVLLHAFPRGARPGELIHKVFELIDFTAPEADIAKCTERCLSRFRFSVSEWKDVLTRSVCEVLATPLRAPGDPAAASFTLDRVPRDKRLNELEFIFPLEARSGDSDEERFLFARGALADTFAAHARAPVPADYAEQLRLLPFAPFAGFLRGFVDLIFEHRGRFYVVDYKSNHLGSTPADYAAALLPAAMTHAHYVLQYHLYVVALHRYLAHRLPDYSYDRHFGGVFYLFVRGMAPERGMATGVFADLPPRALIEALSALFAGAPATPEVDLVSTLLRALAELDVLAPIDVHFALGMARLASGAPREVLLGAAIASARTRHGHVCADLTAIAGKPVRDSLGAPAGELRWPDLREWLDALAASPLVGDGVMVRPLALDAARGRLYLRRYWHYEKRLAELLRARAAVVEDGIDTARLREGLARLFPRTPGDAGADGQRRAALMAVLRRFAVISGGPGTGKTSTVVKLLALLVEQARAANRPRPAITLVAPTGKAAARLTESIRAAKERLDCDDAVKRDIVEEAATIHRRLRPLPGHSTRFRHDAANPLAADVVLVDEASMVDLALMVRLVDAVPPQARLILLGDRDQLASVDVGAVLGDICNAEDRRGFSAGFARRIAAIAGEGIGGGSIATTIAGETIDGGSIAGGDIAGGIITGDSNTGGTIANSAPPSPPQTAGIWDSIVHLTRSYRYDQHSGIGVLARAINAGDAAAVRRILASGEYPDIALRPLPEGDDLGPALSSTLVEGYRPYLTAPTAEAKLEAFNRFRVLCAHRRGPHGVETTNTAIERALASARLLGRPGTRYAGRPVLVTANDYDVRLFNGDIGLLLEDEGDSHALRAVFAATDQTLRRLSPARLPPHETAFAMTIHKSQGSEFDRVVVLLPAVVSPILSRELLYTAVTRAKKQVTLFGDAEVLAAAVERRVERASGLREALWD